MQEEEGRVKLSLEVNISLSLCCRDEGTGWNLRRWCMRWHPDLRRTGLTEPPGESLGRGTASGGPRELTSVCCVVQGA